MVGIFPSLISSDLLNLQKTIELLESHVEGFHLDVMDFHFVPNLAFGPDFVNSIRGRTKKQLNIHLMVEYPEKYFDRFKLQDNDIISVHIESPSTIDIEEQLRIIRSNNLIASIALNPSTPLEALISIRAKIDHVLLMSVQPGFSGQKFLSYILDKLKALNAFRLAHNLSFDIEMDGGINTENLSEIVKNGVNQVAVGSAIFEQKNIIQALNNIKNSIK